MVIIRLDACSRSPVHGREQINGTVSGGCGLDTFASPGQARAFITDNQGIVKQLLDRRRMCRSGSREGTTLALPAWDILHEGLISLRWRRGHPERREKDHQAWSRDDWGSYLANLYAPPRADPSPSPITRILQVSFTDLAAFRQQLVPHTQLQTYDNRDEAVLSTLNARLLLARSHMYRCTRDQYRASRGALPRWRSTTPTWASRVWGLHKVSLRRRGTLLKTMWYQWRHGENKAVAGLFVKPRSARKLIYYASARC